MSQINRPAKKIWQTPTVELLSTGYVDSGHANGFFEVHNGNHNRTHTPKTAGINAPITAYDNAHS